MLGGSTRAKGDDEGRIRHLRKWTPTVPMKRQPTPCAAGALKGIPSWDEGRGLLSPLLFNDWMQAALGSGHDLG